MRKLLVAAVMLFGTYVHAYDASPRCFKDLELNYFNPQFTSEALSLHHVPQAVWTPILQSLQSYSRQVPALVQKKARHLQPNPLDPFDPEAAYDLLQQTLYEVFAAVLRQYNLYQASQINDNDIVDMFNYITDQQSTRITQCVGDIKKK